MKIFQTSLVWLTIVWALFALVAHLLLLLGYGIGFRNDSFRSAGTLLAIAFLLLYGWLFPLGVILWLRRGS
jgi:hypothetical protein